MNEVALELLAKKSDKVVTISGEDLSLTAAKRMSENNIGSLVVVDQHGAVKGIVTERDLVGRILAIDGDASSILVQDIMTSDVITAPSEIEMYELGEIMAKYAVRHIPILTDGKVAGVVSAREVLAHQRDEFGKARDVTVFAMAKVAESRDPETGKHLEHVRDFTRVLAETMAQEEAFADQVDSTFLRLVQMSCTLHDIGKVAIPDNVLMKPGRLDTQEFEIMKTHCAIGAEMLDSTLSQYPEAKFLHIARDIAAFHHERFDGAGYPYGLAGFEIPLPVRIFSVADVYDALISKRVYKDAVDPDIAAEIVISGDGTQFDSDVIRAFVRCEQKLREIKKLHDAADAPTECAGALLQ